MMLSRTNRVLVPIILGGLVVFIGPISVFAETSSSWTPPIGIPMPPFGINEQAPPVPNPWTAQVPGFYYVETSHPRATDRSNPYGTPAKPRVTIPLTLPAGSVVEVHGRYTQSHSSPNIINMNGIAASPVFIRGSSATSKPFMTKGWQVRGTYFILENLEFGDEDGDLTGGYAGKLTFISPTAYTALRRSDVHGNLLGGGIGIASFTTDTASNIVIYNNYIHDNGDVNANFDQDVHCIGVSNNVNNAWVLENELARCSGDGIQINAGTPSKMASTHHIYFGRNTAHHMKQSGFWSKQAVDVIFSQNTVYGIKPSGSSPNGACAGYGYGPERVWFIYNDLHDCFTGIIGVSPSGPGGDGPGQNIYIIGNKIHDIHVNGSYNPNSAYSNAAITSWGGRNRYIIQNTIYDVDAGINSPDSGAMYIENNIISKITQPGAKHIFLGTPTNAAQSTMQNNMLGGPLNIRWGGASYTSLSGFQSATGKGQNSLNSDPLFVNPAGNDFHLQSSSPAIDTGLVSDVYATFQGLYGLSIAFDFDKGSRPQGSAWDIGTYEFAGGSPTPPPPPEPLPPPVPVPIPTVSLAAVPSSITVGGSAALSWFSTHATTCSASASPPDSRWAGSQALTGTQPVSPAVTTTYSLTCTGAGGTKTEGMRVTVTSPPTPPPDPTPPAPAPPVPPNPPPPPTPPTPTPPPPTPPPSIPTPPAPPLRHPPTPPPSTPVPLPQPIPPKRPSPPTLSPPALPPRSAVYSGLGFLQTRSRPPTSPSVSNTLPPLAPRLTLSASPETIAPGQTSTLHWSAEHVSACSASGGWWGRRDLSGTQGVAPSVTTTYTLTCTGQGGRLSASTTITVTQAALTSERGGSRPEGAGEAPLTETSQALHVTTDAGTPVSVTLNATATAQDPHAYALTMPPAHGSLSGTAPQFTYTPAPNFSGTDVVAFTHTDEQQHATLITLVIEVRPVLAVDETNAPDSVTVR